MLQSVMVNDDLVHPNTTHFSMFNCIRHFLVQLRIVLSLQNLLGTHLF